jgi:hypothetical protein
MLIEDNQRCLHQGVELLHRCSDEDYVRKAGHCFNSSVGGHIRHIIDHYNCLFAGLAAVPARIDYDARGRDTIIEGHPATGIAALEKISSALGDLGDLGQDLHAEVLVKMDSGSEYRDHWAPSTLQRELQFLLSHTIHHYALIATICTVGGLDVPAHFGVAPSTLRYREQIDG